MYIDCTWLKAKNFQKLNTVEMFFYIDTEENFSIEYNFHPIDLEIWKEIIEIHKQDCETELYDLYNNVVKNEKMIKKEEYYTFKLKSKNANLYRNINLILYLKNEQNWDNMDEMININTWK